MLKQKNNIFYVITSLDYGGSQKNLYYILKYFPKEYKNYIFEPIVISFKKGGRFKNRISCLGVKVYDLCLPEKISFLTFFILPYSIFKFFCLVIKYRPKIIHSFLFQANFLSRFVKFFLPKTKIFCSERVAEKHKLWQLKLLKLSNFLVEKIFVNSEDLKSYVIKTQKVNQQKVLVIQNIIDLSEIKIKHNEFDIRKQLGISEKCFFVISIGRLERQKGFDLSIEVVKNFNEEIRKHNYDRDYVFVIIGDGIEYNRLINYAKKLEVEKYIRFLGYKENIYDYINACDLFLLTSYWEGSPNVVLEALALKRPVISSEVEGISEFLNKDFIVSLKKDRKSIIEEFVEKILNIYLIEKGNLDYTLCINKRFNIDIYLPNFVVGKFLNHYIDKIS